MSETVGRIYHIGTVRPANFRAAVGSCKNVRYREGSVYASMSPPRPGDSDYGHGPAAPPKEDAE